MPLFIFIQNDNSVYTEASLAYPISEGGGIIQILCK